MNFVFLNMIRLPPPLLLPPYQTGKMWTNFANDFFHFRHPTNVLLVGLTDRRAARSSTGG